MADTKLISPGIPNYKLQRNLKLNDKYISNDGGDEGIAITNNGSTVISVVDASSILLDGTDDYITLGDELQTIFRPASNPENATFTISAWIKPSTISGHRNIVSKFKIPDHREFQFYVEEGILKLALSEDGTDALPVIYSVAAAYILSVDTWYQVGVTVNLQTDTYIIYRDGINIGSYTNDVAGNSMTRILPTVFNGTSTKVTIPTASTDIEDLFNGVDKFTIAFWVKTDSSAGINHGVWGIVDASDATETFRFSIYNSNAIYWIVDGASNAFVYDASGGSVHNVWTHYVLVYDGTEGGIDGVDRAKIYMNGAALSLDTPGEAIPTTIPDMGSADFTLGHSIHESYGISQWLKGNLSEVAIWSGVAIDADGVSAFYNSGDTLDPETNSGNYDDASGLDAYWKLNQGASTSITDSHEGAYNGTAANVAEGSEITDLNDTDAHLAIGSAHGEDDIDTFAGTMDDVAIWNSDLDSEEMELVGHADHRDLGLPASYKNEATQASLVGYWRLDEGTGSTTADESGQGNDGTIVGSPTWPDGQASAKMTIGSDLIQFHVPIDAQGSGGQRSAQFSTDPQNTLLRASKKAVKFTGTPEMIACGDAADTDDVNDLSVAFWVNFSSIAGEQQLVTKGAYDESGDCWAIKWDAGTLQFSVSDSITAVDTDLNLNIDTWYHIVVTYSNTSDALVFYLNGVSTVGSGFTIDVSGGGYILIPENTGRDVRIGFGYEANDYFNGTMQEVGIWDTALSAAEVTAIYNNGRTLDLSIAYGGYAKQGDLQAYLKMDEATGTSFADSSTHSNTGTGTGIDVTNWVDGNTISTLDSDYNSVKVYKELDINNAALKLTYDTQGSATFTVADNGVTTIATSDAIGSDANFILDVDGDINFDASGGDFSFTVDSAAKATLDTSGNFLVAGTLASRGSTHTIGTAGNTTATTISTITNTSTTAGKNLSVSAGSTTTGGNNINGGDLILASGAGDGTGTSSIQFQTKVSGTDAVAERMRIDSSGNLLVLGKIISAFPSLESSAAGDNSSALGNSCTASGDYSVAIGLSNTASGEKSATFGCFGIASGTNSLALGTSPDSGTSTASGIGSIVIGATCTASANYSLAAGEDSTASAINAVAIGRDTTASGVSSVALGKDTTASGYNAFCHGRGMTVSGDYSFGIALESNSDTVSQDNTMVVMGGKLGIGVVDPDVLLEIFGTSTQLKLSHNAADYATFTVADTGDLTIATVGDGSLDSDLTLDADGDIKLEPVAGKVILLDGTVSVDGGSVTGITTLGLDSVSLTAIQISSESFVDNDTSIMTSAAIQDKILGYSYSTATGTVTSVGTTGTVNGVTLTGTVTSSGNLTLGGTLAINNGDWSGTDLSVANGGTGASTFTTDGVLFGNGTSAISAVDLSSNGNIIVGGSTPAAVTGANLAGAGLAATVGDGTLVLAVETLNQDTTGTAATVTGAAQTNITSLGTLTALTVDDVVINGKVITITGDTDDTFTITAGTHGATTIATVDGADAEAAHLTFDIQGDTIFKGDIADGTSTEVARIDASASSLFIASGKKIEFGAAEEYISGDTNDLTITSGVNLNIDAGGHVEFDGCGVGFDLETPTYDASDTDVNFINGNKQFVTFGSGNITDLNLIFPRVSGNFLLMLKQDGTGSRLVTNYKVWDRADDQAASGSATVKFAGGSNPTLTTDANHVDIISFFYDGDNEIAYGVATLDFQF